jgi:hypothetical protein
MGFHAAAHSLLSVWRLYLLLARYFWPHLDSQMLNIDVRETKWRMPEKLLVHGSIFLDPTGWIFDLTTQFDPTN